MKGSASSLMGHFQVDTDVDPVSTGPRSLRGSLPQRQLLIPAVVVCLVHQSFSVGTTC